jgi:FtsP/CotA-like multicopper oxidase with cupredoxin domain
MTRKMGRRKWGSTSTILAATTALLAVSAASARGVTSVASGIAGVQQHFPAGLLDWSSGGCGPGIDFCATLDFCRDGGDYGYALPGHACQAFNGPTIRLSAGNRYRLTLRNASGRTTNLHTHGLHVVGAGDSDDVTRSVAHGDCLDYVWDIARDHPGGTNWYHPHHHPLVEEQVNGGAFGLIIVDDNRSLNPNVPQWAQYERVLQIFRSNQDRFLANGQNSYEVGVERNRWFRLRVSVVDPRGGTGRFTIGSGCEYMKVAHDGIWSSTVPQPARASHLLAGASRADFAVRCQSTASITFRGRTVGQIRLSNPTSNALGIFTWIPNRPASMQDIRNAFVPFQNNFDITMSETGINNIFYNRNVPLRTLAYNQVHEWNIRRSEIHSFHLHMYHVMIVSPGGCGEMHQEGEFYDTVSGTDFQGQCRVRFKTADFGQRTMVHCHVLEHSDQGAMGWVDVFSPGMPTNNANGDSYQCRAPAPAPGSSASSGGSGSSGTINSIGQEGCNNGSCNVCEGDCDSDADCAGNLECFLRDDFEHVPGCSGEGHGGK